MKKFTDKRTRLHLGSLRAISTIGILFLIAFWSGTITGGKTLEERLQGTIMPTPTVSLEIEAVLPTEIATPTPTPKQDSRVGNIYNYYAYNNAPLKNYATVIVQQADRFGVDPYLIAAIGQIESSGGKNLCRGGNNNNPFGLLQRNRQGGYDCMKFASFDEAIYYEAKLLGSELYKGKSIAQVGSIYCPNSQSWIDNVQYVYNKISK